MSIRSLFSNIEQEEIEGWSFYYYIIGSLEEIEFILDQIIQIFWLETNSSC